MKHVDIYTDGACSGNPGPGGYGAILVFRGLEREISGGHPETTNNRMELLGAISALELLKEPCNVLLTSDSKYLVDGINLGWAKSWKRNNWTKSDKKQDCVSLSPGPGGIALIFSIASTAKVSQRSL